MIDVLCNIALFVLSTYWMVIILSLGGPCR
jgi:hypothetical protein